MRRIFLMGTFFALFLAACVPETPVFVATEAAPPTSPAPSASPPTAVPTPAPSLWISAAVPEELREAAGLLGFDAAAAADEASLTLEPATQADDALTSTWVYTLVAAFPTVRDGVAFSDLQAAWNGNGQSLVMTEPTYGAIQTLLDGEAGPGVVRIISERDMEYALWAQREAWGIVPFESLSPKMKVLEVDRQAPIRKDFNLEEYPLRVGFTVRGGKLSLPASNRDADKMATVVMTGVTALVRATAYKMELNGNLYPARDLGDLLRQADIAHISNEIPFAEGCPYPNPDQRRLIFCSDPKYIELLESIGTDVVELTGNHFEDWGKEATFHTIEMYKELNWPYFGGGADLADAQKPAILERGGMSFAFIGCNPVGPEFAWARADGWPGAAPCGDYEWIVAEIARLKAEGHIVLATFQYFEYYSPEARPWQQADFRRLADAGAVTVNGSQAHYPQVMEFYGDSFIHYGLGNLFFDQMGYDNPSSGIRTTKTRSAFITRYIFYEGRLASVELLTTMLEDFAKPRLMTPQEREAFLDEYFKASGW
ncbi:MAG: CapA family protein [Anaerolineales bacterium]|nr:CapA family protein [Anaerolineales bacterium]